MSATRVIIRLAAIRNTYSSEHKQITIMILSKKADGIVTTVEADNLTPIKSG
jgi:hypothetical protein